MTMLDARPDAPIEPLEPGAPDETPPAAAGSQGDELPAVNPITTSLAVFLSTGAAGWMCGGIFGSLFARMVGVAAALLGTGIVALSYRLRRPSALQHAAPAIGALAAALFVLPSTKGGSANLPSLVAEAIRAGGIATPPLPFDPGWRFLLITVVSVLGAGAASLAVNLRRPKVGIFLPAPVLFGATLLQPPNTPVILTVFAVALVPAAVAISHGAELAREGSTSGGFEARRLLRSAGVLGAMMALLVVLSQLGILFPERSDSRVLPPQRPEAPPPQADRPLFTVDSPVPTPWRLGVLDVYDGKGWLLPPYDPARMRTLDERSGFVVGPPLQPPLVTPGRPTFTATFTIKDVQGHVLPGVANPLAVPHEGFMAQLDPRTQMLRVPEERATAGMRYTVEAPVPAGGAELSKAPAPSDRVKEYLQVPAPPDEIIALLGAAPTTNLYDRLQYVRNAYYSKVVAAGPGKPVDVPPDRVVAMLAGNDASPYEITAGEVVLARWAGIPARVGFGWYGGERLRADSTEVQIRPKNGATWLEAWFEGYGWVPILGIPPQAKASLNNKDKQQNPDVRPSKNLALTTYVPVRVESLQLFFELVRYWLARAVPIVLLIVLVVLFYPGVVKLARRVRRRRWADRRGPAAAIAVTYAEFRDDANDLNIGSPIDNPLEYLRRIGPDVEHQELAWLVTRALWGDLHRDLRPEDAEAADGLARSVGRRLRRAQPAITRILAVASRVSLRHPFTDEVPNLWVTRPPRARRVALWQALRRPRRAALRPIGAGVLAVVVMAGTMASCGNGSKSPAVASPELPSRLVPDEAGPLRFQPEPKLEEGYVKAQKTALVAPGRVFSIRRGRSVVGSLQLAPFKAGLIRSDRDADQVRAGVVGGLGNGTFKTERFGHDVVLTQAVAEQKLFLSFPKDMSYFMLLVASRELSDPGPLFASVLRYQRGEGFAPVGPDAPTLEVVDPMRGGVE